MVKWSKCILIIQILHTPFQTLLPDVESVRENGVLFSERTTQEVTTSSVADFNIGKYTFEIGGKNKAQKQIEGIENAYVVKDDIEYGYKNIIPLWAFGLTY